MSNVNGGCCGPPLLDISRHVYSFALILFSSTAFHTSRRSSELQNLSNEEAWKWVHVKFTLCSRSSGALCSRNPPSVWMTLLVSLRRNKKTICRFPPPNITVKQHSFWSLPVTLYSSVYSINARLLWILVSSVCLMRKCPDFICMSSLLIRSLGLMPNLKLLRALAWSRSPKLLSAISVFGYREPFWGEMDLKKIANTYWSTPIKLLSSTARTNKSRASAGLNNPQSRNDEFTHRAEERFMSRRLAWNINQSFILVYIRFIVDRHIIRGSLILYLAFFGRWKEAYL